LVKISYQIAYKIRLLQKKGVGKLSKKTMGIHHITAIVGNPQENVDFYA
jgi:hypothetical protein